MNIQELLKTDADFTVSIGIKDLRVWHSEVIEDTRRKLEEVVMSDKLESYLSPSQVSEMVNVDLSTLWRWQKKGYLVPIELGGKRKYRMSDIQAILNSGKEQVK
ncbi:MAG: helix-turn-helix domain-containing protein [Mariniphaga sp.]